MTNSPRQGTATLAVLIDADNAAPAIIEGLLAEIAKYGVAAVKRIYGDWTKPNLSGWKECLLSHSIQPIQQFRYTVGKNATDSAMIIDAMDLLYTERFDGFCLVSSDSDFTRLASRIREQGLIVYGFGERKTPKPFVTACDRFIYSDVLRADADAGTDEAAAPVRRRNGGELRQDSRLVRLLQSASQAVSDEDGWSTLGGMGNHIAKQAPEFDSRNYGYGKLSELVAATGLFEVETRNGGNNKTIWVRLKKRGKGGQDGDGRGVSGQRQPEKAQGQPQIQPQQTQPAPQPEHRRPAAQPEVVAAPVSVPEPEPVVAPMEVTPVVPEAVPEPAPAPEVEALQAEVVTDAVPEEPAAPAARKTRKRAPRRPEVSLSETPWPIDQSVFAAPGDTVLTAQVQEAFEGFSEAPVPVEEAVKPVRKTRRKVKA